VASVVLLMRELESYENVDSVKVCYDLCLKF
jgi:hypothetical protein